MKSHSPFSTSILIFTDGACSGNPGPGGWGAIVVTPEGKVKELGGRQDPTTNNQMELLATIEALRFVEKDLRPIQLYTDSVYVIRGITQWIWGWRRNGWKNKEGEPIANQDLWTWLSGLVGRRAKDAPIDWLYSRGHVGTPGNERCDEIAVSFSQRKRVDLYAGSLINYPLPIFDLPENTQLPEMNSPSEKKKTPLAYLSYVDGKLERHLDWTSCQYRVKNRSHARFKKVFTEAEVQEVLRSWGVGDALLKLKPGSLQTDLNERTEHDLEHDPNKEEKT